MLGPCLSHLNKVEEAPFALFESGYDSLFRELWEVFILNYKVMKIVSEVVSASSTSVSVKTPKKQI